MAWSIPSTTAAYRGRTLGRSISFEMRRVWSVFLLRAGSRSSSMSAYFAFRSSGASSGVWGAMKGMYRKNGFSLSRSRIQREASSASRKLS
jgi:hypothetical protein